MICLAYTIVLNNKYKYQNIFSTVFNIYSLYIDAIAMGSVHIIFYGILVITSLKHIGEVILIVLDMTHNLLMSGQICLGQFLETG